MKKLLIISAIVIPTLLFAQQNNTPANSIPKQGNCNPVLADSHHDKDTCTLSVLLKHPYITVPCGNVVSYCVSLPVNGMLVDKLVSGKYIPEDVLELLKSDKYDCYIIIKLLCFKANDNSIKNARGMLIHLLKK